MDRPTEELLARTEQWFISRGTPHFIEDYSAARDVFTRAAPVLTVIFLVEVLAAVNTDWHPAVNAVVLLAGVGLLLGTWAAVNRLRGRPALARPESVGPVELTVFVVAPAALHVLFGAQAGAAVAVAMTNLLLLGAIYAVTSYALLPLTRWALVKTARELGAVAGLLARALPLLLLFMTFLFINAEVWQVAAVLEGGFLALAVGLFTLVGTAFILARLPSEIRRLSAFSSSDDVASLCEGSPLDGWCDRVAPVEAAPLSGRQRANVVLVMLFSQGLQVVLVGLTIAAFFMVFGLLTITPAIVEHWTGSPGDALVTWQLWGRAVVPSVQLVRVSVFLGSFSALYFAVYAITDATYRQEFFDVVVDDVRRSLAVRTVYLGLRR
ncbi:MAG TPA: hypothetical protein VMN58_08210 [Acidimicrobiales bacterium]|nr:hypothetical protein [Acidimicrobiales bacterium]